MLLRAECHRALVPRFLFGKAVLAWQCSICGKIFSLRVEEVQQLACVTAPQQIWSAFGCHDCELELEAVAERAQKRASSASLRPDWD